MAITKVAFGQIQQGQAIFAQAQKNSTELQSLKQAVLDSANDRLELDGYVPEKGAKWTSPGNGQKYNVHWNYIGAYQTATTVSVDWIRPRA